MQRRVDAGEAPALSAWVAAAVEARLRGDTAQDDRVADLEHELQCAEAEADIERANADAARSERGTVQAQLTTVQARYEAQCDAVAALREHLADLRAERDRLLQERDAAVEELRQRSLPMVVEQPGGLLARLLWWKQL